MKKHLAMIILPALFWAGCDSTAWQADTGATLAGSDASGEGRAASDSLRGVDTTSPDPLADGRSADNSNGGDASTSDLAALDAASTDAAVADGMDHDGSDSSSSCPNGVCPPVANVCVLACATPADCVYAGTAPGGIYDEDSWVCNSGRCAHLGCLSDAECSAQPGLDYASMKCVMVSGGYKSCLAACSAPGDCPHPSRVDSPLYGADNYECKAGVCSYIGCHSDAECQEGISGTALAWVCSSALYGFPICSTPCTTPSDCTYLAGNPIFDADNYACDLGICRHLGCQSDAECAEAYSATGLSYLCAESFMTR
ncbi:MAG: hypothetical protein FJ109_15185 [Deltaproteobacteria bacterium]|nr:hypothetical protein [Deltaproteobacteria bacterium]